MDGGTFLPIHGNGELDETERLISPVACADNCSPEWADVEEPGTSPCLIRLSAGLMQLRLMLNVEGQTLVGER
ncbi:MAG: hypothetical protein R3B93_24565 [Bacteroidia bacterium]